METPSKAKMFLADERGCNETGWYRSYSTFNFKNYYNEYKEPFNDLYLLNDETLAAGRSLHMNIEESSFLILLPVVGAISYKSNDGNVSLINAGQMQISTMNSGDTFEIANPYEDELVNLLQLRIKANISKAGTQQKIVSFDLEGNKGKLIGVTAQLPLISIGKFGGREEAVYILKSQQSSLFIFIIEGVFEVQGRLLHARDGLALWDESEDVELEALSNDAIVLMIEVSKS